MKISTDVRFVRATTVIALLGLAVAGGLSLSGDSHAQQAQPPQPAQQAQQGPQKSPANTFNRLLKAPTAKNATPTDDGIHDAQNPGTGMLQWPSEAFTEFKKSNDGNLVDWVGTLKDGKIAPWFDFEKKTTEPFLFDLVIVREVKGSMPNVVFPHEAHTQWLDCSNCHDEIFIPQKGANEISMAAILLGQKCGVCHGRVAFPVTDCRRCHANPKTAEQLRALAEKSNWAKTSGMSANKPPETPAKDATAKETTTKDSTTKK